jgi:hypothetical protein
MFTPTMLTRRQAACLPVLAAGCASAGPASPADLRFANLETLSESVHSGVASEDGAQRLTMRLCRYPALGLSWLWIHARIEDRFYSFVDHLAPCTNDPVNTDTDSVAYADKAGALVFRREGRVGAPTAAGAEGVCRAHRSVDSRFGAGDTPLAAKIRFSPERLYAGLNRGRTEVFGRGEAEIELGGRSFRFTGPAQFHEQGQIQPRFTAPFCYATLWGDGAASTLLITRGRREGYLLEGDRAVNVTSVSIGPRAPRRAIVIGLADGRRLEGEAVVRQAYTLPITGQIWRGHMVDVELAGRIYRGHVNDYDIADGIPYMG